jgi:hypothetical protein
MDTYEEKYNELIKVGASEEAALQAVQQIPGYSKRGQISADEVLDNQEMPEVNYGGMSKNVTGSFDKIIAGASASADYTASQIEDWKTQQEELNKTLQGAGVDTQGKSMYQSIIDLFNKKPTSGVENKLAETQEQQNIPQLTEEQKKQATKVATLQGEINKLDTLKLNALQQIEQSGVQRGASMRYIKGEQGEIERQYDIEKSYKVAELGVEALLLEVAQGNLQNAQAMVGDIVNAYTYDYEQKVNDFNTLFNVYGSWIEGLDTKQQNILKEAREDAIRAEENAKEETAQKLDLIREYNKYGAGISLDDTLEEANEKASKVVVTDTSFTKNQTELLSSLLAGVGRDENGNFTSREEALADLELNSTSILLNLGQTGYDIVKAEIDRLFPAPVYQKTKAEIEEERKTEYSKKVEEFKKTGKAYIDEKGDIVFPETTEMTDSFMNSLYSY